MEHHRWRRSPEPKYAAVRAALFAAESPAKQPAALNDLLSAPGCEELVGPISHALSRIGAPAPGPQKSPWRNLYEVAHKTFCEPKGIPLAEETTLIPTNRVFSAEWAPDRSKRIHTIHGEKGTLPGPASVASIALFGTSYYSIRSGNHRTEAAKTLGRTHIEAVIEEYASANPKEWEVGETFAIHRPSGRRAPLPVDECAALIWLGASPLRSGTPVR